MPIAFIDSPDGDHTNHVGGDRLPTSVTVLDACPRAKGPRFTAGQSRVAARLADDGGAMDTAPFLTLGNPETSADLARDVADTLLKCHYSTAPAGAYSRVVSRVNEGEPLRLEMRLSGDLTVPTRVPLGMGNVIASHSEVSNPDLPLSALFDSQDDPPAYDEVSGPLYHQMPSDIVGFVVLDLAAPTLITSVSFYMAPFRLYRCPRNYRVFSGQRAPAHGPW
jgi:hypothetical protein